MFEIKIFCKCECKYKSLEILFQDVLDELKTSAKFEKYSGEENLQKFSIEKTPAVIVNGNLFFSGKTPSGREVKKLLKQMMK